MVRPSVHFDIDLLRTFVTGSDLGSFAKAAERLARSPSAISLHLRRLEEQAGQPLFRKQGRGLALTDAGETLMVYARRILALNDEARLALADLAAMEGWVRVGVPEDFSETVLPSLLARFQRAHPKVRVEARVDRGSVMAKAVEAGALDLALTWGTFQTARSRPVGERRLAWIAAPEFEISKGEPVPLVMFDAPCAFREKALAALESGGLSWRPVFATASVAGVWAAVRAGLGITVRLRDDAPAPLRALRPGTPLPDPGVLDLRLHEAPRMTRAASAFAELLVEATTPAAS